MLFIRQAVAPGMCFLLALSVVVVFNLFVSPQEPPSIEWTTAEYEDEGDENTDNDELFAVNIKEDPIAELVTLAVETEEQNTKTPWLEYRIRRGDRIDKILKTIGASKDTRKKFLAKKLKSYRLMRVGDFIQFRQNDANVLTELIYKTTSDYYLLAKRDKHKQWVIKEAPPVKTAVTVHKGGRIDTSLFLAADKAGIPDAAIDQFIKVLEWHIDFYRDVRKGDTFRLIYTQEQDEDGQLLAVPTIQAYEYINRRNNGTRIILGLWNNDKDGFYSPQGESMQGAFLRTPLKYKRISSRFSNRRFHPILKRWRSHKGVDYAAASGTPVRSTAEGVISLVERQRGYGKVVMIKHFKIYKTVYGHLKRFAKGIKKGRRVNQGQIIGYVGKTGLATGPHLHYEFRVRNKHKDPLSASVPKQLPALNQQEIAKFKETSAKLKAELEEIALL